MYNIILKNYSTKNLVYLVVMNYHAGYYSFVGTIKYFFFLKGLQCDNNIYSNSKYLMMSDVKRK